MCESTQNHIFAQYATISSKTFQKKTFKTNTYLLRMTAVIAFTCLSEFLAGFCRNKQTVAGF